MQPIPEIDRHFPIGCYSLSINVSYGPFGGATDVRIRSSDLNGPCLPKGKTDRINANLMWFSG